jgi:hypothetical protein
MKLNPKLKNFWRKKARLKILYGGRASSKTHDAGGMAVYLARHYTVKFLCTRQFQNRISESVYTVLKQKIEEAGWTDEFTITNNRIIHNTTKSDDSTVFCERNGLVVEPLKVKTKQSTVEIASWITYEYNQSTPDAVVVDTVGLGAGVYDQLATAGVYSIDGNAGMKADDDRYFNKRSEMYFNLKEAIKKGLKLPKDDGLLEELMSITYTFNEKGQMRLESKDKIKETLGRSPDKSDAVALTFFTTIIPKQMEEQFYSTSYSNGAW